MTTFVEQQFPPEISYGSKGGPSFSTDVFTATSGAEQRNINWELSRCRYDVSHGIKTRAQMDDIIEFFYAMKGKAIGFRFKDWSDYTLTDGQIGVGTGVLTTFQIKKLYTVGSETYSRNLKKIVASTLVVKVNGVTKTITTDYTVDLNTGIITFVVAPTNTHPVTATCEFDVPVRFDTDEMNITQEAFELETWDSIPLVEIKPLA